MAFSVLEPVPITATMVTASSLTVEDDSPVWQSGRPSNSYVVGDKRHRVETHSVYERIKAEASGAAENTPPENDPEHWLYMRPTNKWAMFDAYTRTRTTAQNRLSVTLRPGGFVTAVWLGGLDAKTAKVTVRSRPDGPVVYDSGIRQLDAAVRDRWSLYWLARPHVVEDTLFPNIRPCIDPNITIELTRSGSVGLGMVVLGQLVRIGETQWGAGAGPTSNSFIDFKADGTAKWTRRDPTRTLNCNVEVQPRDANMVSRLLARLDGVPALYIASSRQRHEPLRVFGFMQNQPSQVLRFENVKQCMQPINVIGL
nr:MAG TPA: hypothetical protein [Caudoviricetes sp.]